jgi:hypothetical protein
MQASQPFAPDRPKSDNQKATVKTTHVYSIVLTRFLNIYYPLTFLLVFCIGIFSWFNDIPNKQIIPFVILFYALVLVPGLLFREIVSYTTILCYPIIMIANGYEYSIAISCWYPVLLNAFIISLLRKRKEIFIGLCTYHLSGLIILTILLVNVHIRFWYLGAVTNIMASCVLGLTYYLFIQNEQLNGNLQKLLKIVRHDVGNWVNLLTLGISLSKKNKETVHKLIEEGTNNLNNWIHRLKTNVPFNTFSFLEIVPLQNIVNLLDKTIGDLATLTFSCDDSLKGKSLLTDSGILINCFMNLVRNAVQANATSVEIAFAAENKKICSVYVKDNGAGIAKHIAEALFSMQVTTEKAAGSGFGLLGVKYNLDFIGCSIELVDANTQGNGKTIFKINGIKTT